MKKIFFALFFATPVFAAKSYKSAIYYQPKAHQHSLLVDYVYGGGSVDVTLNRAAYGTIDYSAQSLNGSYLYGLNDFFAFGISDSYGTGLVKLKVNSTGRTTDFKSSGLSDVNFIAKGFVDTGMMVIRYGGDLAFALETSKSSGTNFEGNRSSGGSQVTPYIVGELGFDNNNLRLALGLNYRYYTDRKSENSTGVQSTTTGGNKVELSPSVEMDFGPATLFGQYIYTSTDSSKVTEATTTTSSNGSTTHTFGAGAYYDFNPNFTMRGTVIYATSTYPATATLDSYDQNILIFSVGGIINFGGEKKKPLAGPRPKKAPASVEDGSPSEP
jgi:hypothetical protein